MEIRTLERSDEATFRAMEALLLAEKEAGNHLIETSLVKDFERHCQKLKRQETEMADPNWSTVTTYFAFLDGEMVGKVSCRWELDKGDLATVGGHIGYVTSPKFRRRGVMKEMLDFAFDRYRERGITRIFITALEENVPSRRTIESVGGVLQDIIEVEDGNQLARYWVEIGEE
ncbi:GNAT family N-acetyltransferase [Streptococcus caprae]|uniref:GNAT family N-acetyltransferase n=1 Tax=Streptococcus caprae TaxID=1640501 RepID=A0ABV8CVH8_9STRE